MANNTTFDLQSAKRIAQATQWVEQEREETVLDRWYRRGHVPTGSALGFVKASIASGASGTVYMATGEPLSEVAGTEERTVYNGLRATVWQDSLCAVQIPAVLSSGSVANWHIVSAYSATRLSGIVDATTTGPNTFTLESVSPMDGTFTPTTASVYLLTGYQLFIDTAAIARWNETDSRWETVGCCT